MRVSESSQVKNSPTTPHPRSYERAGPGLSSTSTVRPIVKSLHTAFPQCNGTGKPDKVLGLRRILVYLGRRRAASYAIFFSPAHDRRGAVVVLTLYCGCACTGSASICFAIASRGAERVPF